MTTLPLTEVRDRLSELIDELARTHKRITITRHGEPAAVLVSPDDLAALEETLAVLAEPGLLRQLAESRSAIATGDVLDADDLAAFTVKRKRSAEALRRLVEERRDSPTVPMAEVMAETLERSE